MLGLAALSTIPVAGSPLDVVSGTLWVCDTGTIRISGGALSMLQVRHMTMDTGLIRIAGQPVPLSRKLMINAEGGQITLTGGALRAYKSSYSSDAEMIRVTPEVTAMHLSAEPRNMAVAAAPSDGIVDEDNDAALEPRLRRT